MEPVILTSIINTPTGINHSLVEDLISGKKVVDALTYEDSVTLEQAMFEKLKTKYQSIYKGFSLEGERESTMVKNRSDEMVKREPRNRIDENSFKFSFALGWRDHFVFRSSFDNSYRKYIEIPESEVKNGVLRRSERVESKSVEKFDIYYENGVDQGNAYGTKIDYISRSYKVKSMKLIMKRLEEIIDKFIVIADEKRPEYVKLVAEHIETKKREVRNGHQKKFSMHNDNLGILKSLANQYGTDNQSGSILIYDRIIREGKAELKRVMELGEVAWIAPNGKKYKDLRVFL